MPDLAPDARMAWKQAAAEAAHGGHLEIEPGHLLLGLLALDQLQVEGDGGQAGPESIRRAFSAERISASELRAAVRRYLPTGRRVQHGATVHRSQATRDIFEHAQNLAPGTVVTAAHLLAALLEDLDRDLTKAFKKVRLRPRHLLRSLELPAVTRPQSPGPGSTPAPESSSPGQAQSQGEASDGKVLETFGKDLTAAAEAGRIPPIIGRRNEILQTIQALARKKKNNPVLVGDAGVGKTAIVEALALRAVQGKDPQVLGGRRIIELDMGSLLSGTSLRGQFEERMKTLIEEAAADDNLILFIDEIHTIMGAGGGAQDAAQLLKPAMSRGAIRLIGATTVDEYRQYIEKDPAMDRRFEKILVEEPPRDEAVEMLMGLRDSLSRHHGAVYGDDAVEAAVDLSIRIDVDHRLPDKAIDLLDRAGARSTVSELSMNPLELADGAGSSASVTALDIANVLAEKMGMPVEVVAGHLDASGAKRLLHLESFLQETVKGQDQAIAQLSERVILAHASVMERRGPLGTMLFLGPSGVGKTELAKQLGLFLFGSEKNLIRLDMSEFKEEHSVSKLIGSPPGYVGSDQEGQLTGQIRRKPYSIVLLDEVEKAHQRIYDVFLQAFDEGRLTDSKGRLADARNCIFILTTNVRPEADPQNRIAINEALKTWFRPELINRIDEVISFNHLSPESIREILDGLLKKLAAQLVDQHGVRLHVTEAARDFLAEDGYNPEYGAREMRRTVERMAQVPLSKLVLSGALKEHPAWKMDVDGDSITFVRN